ncbi:hypothetical protein CFT61_05180 [Segatella copri]|uniref:Uncharacterized protein n=1 Tax=Segatella copri TaxID=165179 RepID=A0AA91TKJ0_9BACT|nr:hypothetical protein CFT61_05180 [Segatella copri]
MVEGNPLIPEAARPERAKAPSPGQRPGNYGRKRAALKGQKLLAQGIALGIIAVYKTPCKGKSFQIPGNIQSFCPYRATGLRP